MGYGRKKLREGYKISWSGETSDERNGVTITVIPTYSKMVTETECTSKRVMKRILMKEKEISTLQIYAPQTGCSNEEKDKLIELFEDNTSGEHTYIKGDFNAQIGKDTNGYKIIT
jgi:hypothetical protein